MRIANAGQGKRLSNGLKYVGPKTLPCNGHGPPLLVTANHDHWNCYRLSDSTADRSQKHAGKSPAPMATDYHQLGTFGFLNQPPGRLIAEDESLDVHIRVLLLPAGETLGE